MRAQFSLGESVILLYHRLTKDYGRRKQMELNKSGPIAARLRRLIKGPAGVLTTAGVALAVVIASTGWSVGTLFAQSARTATLSLSPALVNQPVGSTFTIDVLVNPGGQPVNGVGAFLDFNPAVLQVNSFTPGTAMQELSRSSSPAGTADFQAGQAPPPAPAPSTPFTLVTITFQVIGAGSTNIAFHRGGLATATSSRRTQEIRSF